MKLKMPSFRVQIIVLASLVTLITSVLMREYFISSLTNYHQQVSLLDTKEKARHLYQEYNAVIDSSEARNFNIAVEGILRDLQRIEIAGEFYTRDIERYSMGIVILMAILVASVFLLLFMMITRPLSRLTDATEELRAGNFDLQVRESRFSPLNSHIVAFNTMVSELNESRERLVEAEKQTIWKEMARAMAHEIKNPLTPMRLTVQSFERKFDPADPGITKKITEFSETLIQQIDTMSAIAAAFSNFANMPAQQRETLEVVSVIKHTLDIFAAPYIDYLPNRQVIHAELDKNQLIRVITNLVKNAIQALEAVEDKKIEVKVLSENGHVKISVSDNGKGISETDQTMIFEPKFTTKTSGMGLGLAIVKNIVEAYNGRIQVVSDLGKGTVFTIVLPLK